MTQAGIVSVPVARPTPTAPKKLKKYKGFRDIEYGPSVMRVLLLYPDMYSEHHNRPTTANPIKTAPAIKNIAPHKLSSHRFLEINNNPIITMIKSRLIKILCVLTKFLATINTPEIN